LRKNGTKAEKILWQRLSNSQLNGLRFKRQHPISNFIADFYCHKCKLVIEIDGSYHEQDEQKKYDENRDQVMREFGLTILRFTNEDVIESLDEVISKIKVCIG
jgi:very-short-patch-repair endonuclease